MNEEITRRLEAKRSQFRDAFTRSEMEAAFRGYWKVGALEERWADWPDLFTEDVVYVEHIYGTMIGREVVRGWISKIMSKNNDVHAILDWYMIEGNRVVFSMQNRYYNPDPNASEPYLDFPGLSVIEYAGDGRFYFEEDYWDIEVSKQCYLAFGKLVKEFGRDSIQETPARMALRDPWPTGSSFVQR